ncbi:unnamed protein product [Arabis nemorensis]|uniref:Uncharacterized protein n=1 Tax=Arabis nemorensis TaxID=586526 RepID=A0A565BP79_9BRAS|nr:unnamed protein product [Arabis nemorensis]
MEIRTETKQSKDSEEDEENDGGGRNYAARFRQLSGGGGSAARTTPRFFNRNGTAGSGSSSGGIRIRIPTGVSIAQPGPRFPARAIKLLGDTLLRSEQAKMEMTREVEAMRMDMEMKRTKMILESQQRIIC